MCTRSPSGWSGMGSSSAIPQWWTLSGPRCGQRYDIRLSAMGLQFLDLGLGSEYVDYQAAWDMQRSIHAEVSAGSRANTVLLLEHASGLHRGQAHRAAGAPTRRHPGHRRRPRRQDHLARPGPARRLPDRRGCPTPWTSSSTCAGSRRSLIAVCADLGLAAARVEGRSGVWLRRRRGPERKVAAIGVRVSRGVTMHGFALNCDCDLSCVRPDRAVRHRRRRRDVADRGARPPRDRRRGGWPGGRRRLRRARRPPRTRIDATRGDGASCCALRCATRRPRSSASRRGSRPAPGWDRNTRR